MATATGRCACGAVRYECSGDPAFMGNCHCRDCQRASGSAYSANIGVPENTVKVTGNVKYHEIIGGSGKPISRGFCANCGSPLFAKPSVMPSMIVINVASLDDPSIYKPAMDIFASSAQPWDHMSPQLAKFPKMPQ
jgi:hypothetical protein